MIIAYMDKTTVYSDYANSHRSGNYFVIIAGGADKYYCKESLKPSVTAIDTYGL